MTAPAEMRALARLDGGGTSAEELRRAQDLAYDAWEEDDRSRRNALARRALAHSPLCADAWLQLSQLRNLTDESRREYLLRAVCAGELAIGERRFAQDRGEFWLVLETRPYMRARHALAEDLWLCGARQEAISHLREMLELNTNDNQGLRYVLLTWLIMADENQTAQKLLDEHSEEISTFMEFTRVLLAYKETGDSEQARSKGQTRCWRTVMSPNILPIRGSGTPPATIILPGRRAKRPGMLRSLASTGIARLARSHGWFSNATRNPSAIAMEKLCTDHISHRFDIPVREFLHELMPRSVHLFPSGNK